MNIKLIAGTAVAFSVLTLTATLKAEADSITAPANNLAAHECSIVEEFKDGTQVIKTKQGLVLKFSPNGLVIRTRTKVHQPGVHAGALSALVSLSK